MNQSHVYKGYVSTYNFEILNSINLDLQLKDTAYAIRNKLIALLKELKGFKFMTALVLQFKKIENDYKRTYDTFYSNSKVETITYENNINDVFESFYSKIASNIHRAIGKGSYWTFHLDIDHNVNISKYNPLAGSSNQISET